MTTTPFPTQCPDCTAPVKAGNRLGRHTKKPWVLYECGNYEGAHWDADLVNCTWKERPPISIPFMPEFKDRMLAGVKTCTARNKRYGQPGDIFKKFGRTFMLVKVERRVQAYVANDLYRMEGFESQDEFIRCWEQLHPRAGYRPEQSVWVHHFRILEEQE
jgi:hypothetical protein